MAYCSVVADGYLAVKRPGTYVETDLVKQPYILPNNKLILQLLHPQSNLPEAIAQDIFSKGCYFALIHSTGDVPDFNTLPNNFKVQKGLVKFQAGSFTVNATGQLYIPSNYTSEMYGRVPLPYFAIMSNPSLEVNSASFDLGNLADSLLLVPNKPENSIRLDSVKKE